MSTPDAPSSTPPAQPARPRKRRLFTCLILALLLVLLLPVLAFFGALGYLKSGGADERIVAEIRKIFGERAKIGGTTSDWLSNLRVQKIQVDGPDGKPAVEVREVAVDWDTQELLNENRIRSVTVEALKATLVRDPDAKWNLEIQRPKGGGESFRVDEIQIKEGEASLQWAPGKALHLQALSGTITQAGPDSPKAFAFHGVLDSLNTLALNGTLGPGAAWTVRADGGIDLDRDASSILSAWLPAGASGQLNLTASARSDALLVNTQRAGPLSFDGALKFQNARVPLSPAFALNLPRHDVKLRGQFAPATKPGEAIAFNDLSVEIANALDFDGAIEIPAGSAALKINNASAEIDSAALLKCFEPALLPATIQLRGDVKLSGVNATIPFADTLAGLQAKGTLSAPALNIGLQGIGELPPAQVAAVVAWPALESASVKLSGIGDVAFSLKKMQLDPNRLALELVEYAKVERFELDIGQFWETELGRRLLTGNFDPNVKPLPAAQIPYHVKGVLRGTKLTLNSQTVGDIQRVTLNGLEIQDTAVLKWPFAFKVPPRPFSGVSSLEADFKKDGSLVAFSVAKKLTTVVPKGETPMQITLSQRFTAGKDSWEMGPLHILNVTIPFTELESIFDIRANSGIVSAGTANFKDIEADLPTGRVKGQYTVAKSTFRIPLPSSAQKSIVGLLRGLDYPTIAAIFETYPVEELILGDLNIRGTLELDGGKATLKGVAEPTALKAVLPVSTLFGSLKEPEVFKFPGAAFALSTDTRAAAGARTITLDLDWGAGQKLELKLKENGHAESWIASGSITLPGEGGLTGTFDVPFDLRAQTLGPIGAELTDVALAPLAERFFKAPAGAPPIEQIELGGRLQNVSLKLDAVSLKNISGAAFANGRLTAQMDSVTYSAPPAMMFDKLTGQFTLDLKSRGDTYGVNTLLKLSNYEALLNDGAIYLPPPEKNKFGALRWVGTVRKETDGWTIQQNQAAIALEDDLSAEAAGVLRFGARGSSIEFETLRVFAKDLKRTVAKYVTPHIKDRAPWFGDVALNGTAMFEGAYNAVPGQPMSVHGLLTLRGTEVALGTDQQFRLGNIDGQLPLSFIISEAPAPVAPTTTVPQAPVATAAVKPLNGTLSLGALNFGSLSAPAQALELEATPNALKVKSPFAIQTPLGAAQIGSIALRNLFTGQNDTAIDFTLATKIDIHGLLTKSGVRIEGMSDCVLAGEPLRCTLEQTSTLRGPWMLSSTGALKAPFFGGQVIVEKIKARGVFGPAPVFGVDAALSGGMDGIRWTQFTAKNQHLGAAITGIPEKQLGKFSLRANAQIRGLEFTEPTLQGLQAFVFDFDSVPFKENEFYYDGEFAMTLNRPLVRAAFPSILFGTEKIARIPFGVRAIGLQYELKDRGLYGPRPKLPNDLVLEGWGSESGIGALLEKTLKQDVKGDFKNVVPWATIIKGFSTKTDTGGAKK